MKNISDAPNYYNDFTVEELELLKDENPAQYALVMERLSVKAKTELQTRPTKSIMEFDDFI